MPGSDIYDEIGVGYSSVRQPDPRIAAQLRAAIGDAKSVVNVGAGAGSYEPEGVRTVAVEPSAVMIQQRPPKAAPVVQASAEHLPFGDQAFDVATAILTIHHWTNPSGGIEELRRVSRRQVVLTWDHQHLSEQFWLNKEYLPEASAREAHLPAAAEIAEMLGTATTVNLAVPSDCTDGFYAAYWARPESYLDPHVRAGISTFALTDGAAVNRAVQELEKDLASGVWDERHGELRERDSFDVGYRILITEH